MGVIGLKRLLPICKTRKRTNSLCSAVTFSKAAPAPALVPAGLSGGHKVTYNSPLPKHGMDEAYHGALNFTIILLLLLLVSSKQKNPVVIPPGQKCDVFFPSIYHYCTWSCLSHKPRHQTMILLYRKPLRTNKSYEKSGSSLY